MKKILSLIFFLGSMLASCSKKDNENIESNAPQGPKMVLTKAADAIQDWRILIDAAEVDRADIWIDLNNNGKKDNGETVTKFAVSADYPLVSKTVTIYGKITWLFCIKNNLTALDVSKNTALERLLCSSNQLTALDLSKNTALENLNCTNNNLTVLDLSKNTALMELACNENQLTAFALSSDSKGLDRIYVHQNKLSTDEMSNLLRNLPDRTGKPRGYLQVRLGAGDTNAMPSQASQVVAVGKNWEIKLN